MNAPPKLPFDCTAQIVGMWESVTFTGGSQTVTQARCDASGQFSGVMTAMGLPGSTYYGTWKAVAVADNSCSITLNIAFPHGTSVTAIYDIVDRNLMTDKATGTQIRRIQ